MWHHFIHVKLFWRLVHMKVITVTGLYGSGEHNLWPAAGSLLVKMKSCGEESILCATTRYLHHNVHAHVNCC
jgi:hypothetical protein